jgi:hypothetical protein
MRCTSSRAAIQIEARRSSSRGGLFLFRNDRAGRKRKSVFRFRAMLTPTRAATKMHPRR